MSDGEGPVEVEDNFVEMGLSFHHCLCSGHRLMSGNKHFYPQSLYVAFLFLSFSFLFLDIVFVAQADLKLVMQQRMALNF